MFSSWRKQTTEHEGIPYKGLVNQGATCYLNSVLQVLFMTTDFREALQRSHSGSLDRRLKELFDDLKKYEGYTYNIAKALGITDGFVQADAAECFEKILRNMTNQEAAQIFQGVLTVKNKCCKCNTETCDDNPCWSLPLELVDSEAEYKVEDGISQYFCPSEVNGPDQLFCGDCNAKTDSTIKLELKHHPEVLTLLLKRFKFDYSNMCYFKVKRRVEIPKYLEIQNQTYELYAFVEHHGNLKSGHYTATIQSQEDKRWYNFNDNRVDSFYQFYQLDKKETFHSAYLLFYRKISAEDALNEENNKGSVSESLETHRSETNKPHKCDEETVKSETNCEMAQSCNSAERREMEKEEEKFISVERDDLKDQTKKSLKKEENLKDQRKMSGKKVEDCEDQTKTSLKKEDDCRGQTKMSLKKEDDFRDQTKTGLKKEDDYRGQTKMSFKKDDLRDQTKMSLKKEDDFRDQTKMILKKEDDLRDQTKMSLKKDDLRDQTKMSLKKEDDLRDQTKMSLKKEDDLRDQTKMSLKKEDDLRDQTKMSLKKEDDFRDQTKTGLKKEDDYRGQTKMSFKKDDLRDQTKMSLKKEDDFRDQTKMILKKEDDLRDQTKMSLKKEDDLRDQTKMSLKKEDDLRDQSKMSLKKEDDFRDQTKMSLKKEDDLRDQTKMSVDKQKDEKNKPEDQAQAAKRLTIYDLYTTSKQSSGRQSEYRARFSERSQEGDKENRRGSTLHEQQSNNKSTESQISPGNQTGRGSIQSSVNKGMAEVQREDFKHLVKHFEGLVNDGQGQSREGPSSTSVDYDAGSRKNSCYQQRDDGTNRDAGNEQRNNVQLPQTGGTTLTNDGCNDDGSGSVQHSGTLYRSSMSVSLQNQSSGKKCDYKEITKRTQNEVILDVLPKRKYNGESDDHQHKHNDERTSERDGRYEATLNRPRSSSEDRKERTNRSNVEKTRESYSSCDRLQHQTEHSKILQQNATSGFINASQDCHVDQNSTEMTPVHTAPPNSDPVSHLTKSVQELTLTDRQTHEDVLTNTPVKTEGRGQQILSSTHYESSYNPESPNPGHSCPTYQNSQTHTAYSYPSFSGHNMPVNTDRRGQQMLSNPHRRSHCNPESPNHGHSCPTYPYSQSNIAHSYPSLSWHNMPVNTDHRGQQMLFNTYNWCGYNLVYPIHGSLYPINQNSQGYIASSCPFYSGHITPAENVTAPTGGLVIPTVFDSSIDPMHNISAPPDPVGPQLGSGIRTTTEILRRETQTGSSHENTERGSSESQAQVITEDSADPYVIRAVCGCLCPKTHHF